MKNCQSVKRLTSKHDQGEHLMCPKGVRVDDLERIPYFVFIFLSELSLETLHDRLNMKCQPIPVQSQPDALFLLDRGAAFINCRDGSANHPYEASGKPLVGWLRLKPEGGILIEMLRVINMHVPLLHRLRPPLIHYFQGATYLDKWGNIKE